MSITKFITDIIIWFIDAYWTFGIFFTMILESALVPIPSEIIMSFAGFVVWKRGSYPWGLLEAVIAGTLGNLIGSLILYYIGKFGGRPLLYKYNNYLLLRKRELKMAEEWFIKYGDYAVFFGRMLPAVRTVISLPAGIFNHNIIKFTYLTILGSIPWNFILTMLGYILAHHWDFLQNLFTLIDVVGIILLLGLIFYVVYEIRFKRDKDNM